MHRLNQIRPSSSARLPIAMAVLAMACALALAGGPVRAGAAAAPHPNFVVIQTDDQTLDGLYAAFSAYAGAPATRAMPNTLNLIAKRGMTFDRYYVSYPLCCPSRVTLLTGRYAHNHHVRGNVPPEGGYTGFTARNAMRHNLAVWLNEAGYRTIHVGKFLNGYGDEPFDNGRTVPPGWDAWHTVLKADTDHYYYGYTMNDNGSIDGPFGDPGSWETREYGVRDDPGCPFAPANGLPCYYETDRFSEDAVEEIRATPPERPFYLQVDYTSPHGDFRHPAGPEPAPRHYGWFEGAPLPHDGAEGLNEGNVSDKPSFIREAPFLTPTELHVYRVYYDKQLEALRSVDDGVKLIFQALGQMHRLRDTYVIFTSDNGFFFGEHRLAGGKFLAYEPSTHVPFLIRGPGVKRNAKSSELAANVDIAPTILELAGVKADASIDGRSMVPFLHNPNLRTNRPILFESFVQTSDVEENGGGPPATPAYESTGGSAARTSASRRPGRGAGASIVAPPKDYAGIRLGPWKYIEWPDGEKELYDIEKDPNELNNRVRERNLSPIRNFLHAQLLRLKSCVGRACSEEAPPIPLTRSEQRRLRHAKHRH